MGLKEIGNSGIGNNDIHTHTPIHNKQTINVLSVPSSCSCSVSVLILHTCYHPWEFCLYYKLSRSSRSFILIGLPFGEVFT